MIIKLIYFDLAKLIHASYSKLIFLVSSLKSLASLILLKRMNTAYLLHIRQKIFGRPSRRVPGFIVGPLWSTVEQ